MLWPLRMLVRLVVLVGLIALGAWGWFEATRSDVVSTDAAVDSYRADPPTAPRLAGAPREGVYSYASSGKEFGQFGPLKLDRKLPDAARLVVKPVPRGFQATWRLSEQHTQAHRYAAKGAWWVLTWRRVDVRFLGVGRDDRREVKGQAKWLPRRPKVGMQWKVRFTTGTLVNVGTGKVIKRATVKVAGKPEPAFIVVIATRTSGAHRGAHRQKIWWSPRLGVPLRVQQLTRLDGVVSFEARANLALRGTSPAT